MALANGGLLALYKHIEILVNSSLRVTKKKGFGHLKNSGEQSRVILALLLLPFTVYRGNCNKIAIFRPICVYGL